MNPTTVRNQGLIFLLIAVATAFGGNRALSIFCGATSGLSLLIFLGLDAGYARRMAGHNRTKTRFDGDRIVGRSSLVITVATSASCFATAGKPSIQADYLQDAHVPLVMVGCVVLAAATVFTSSLVDWYYVLPRRNGTLQIAPPCHGTDSARRKMITRIWFIHRSLAAVAVALGLVAFLVWMVILLTDRLPTTDYNKLFIQTVGVPTSLASIAMLPWFRGLVTILPNIGSNFRALLGDVVQAEVGSADRIGRIYAVSLDHGFTIVQGDGNHVDIKLGDRSLSHAASASVRRCGPICRSMDIDMMCEFGTDRALPDGTVVPQADRPHRTSRFFVL